VSSVKETRTTRRAWLVPRVSWPSMWSATSTGPTSQVTWHAERIWRSSMYLHFNGYNKLSTQLSIFIWNLFVLLRLNVYKWSSYVNALQTRKLRNLPSGLQTSGDRIVRATLTWKHVWRFQLPSAIRHPNRTVLLFSSRKSKQRTHPLHYDHFF
jgi:hypothetical protein